MFRSAQQLLLPPLLLWEYSGVQCSFIDSVLRGHILRGAGRLKISVLVLLQHELLEVVLVPGKYRSVRIN